jgi:hypothetical protein
MRHLAILVAVKAMPGLNGKRKKFNCANTLTALPCRQSGSGRGPENVDAAKPGLYKTANGGGRNPAADVL